MGIGHETRPSSGDERRRAPATMGAGSWAIAADRNHSWSAALISLSFSAPAGDRPATTNTVIDGVSAAILPNGRLVTPAGTEVNVQAPKPFGLALSPDGRDAGDAQQRRRAVLAHA